MAKTHVKHYPAIRTDYCKGCALCVEFCPKKVLRQSERLNALGYYYAEPVNPDDCTGCLVCALMCPECAVEVYDE